MNWEYTGTKYESTKSLVCFYKLIVGSRSYVDIISPTPVHYQNSHERSSYWSGQQADARLKPVFLRQPCSSEQLRGGTRYRDSPPTGAAGTGQANNIVSSSRPPLLRTSSLPPVDPSKQLASTPEISQGTHSPASSQNTPAISQSGFSPSYPTSNRSLKFGVVAPNISMTDPRRNHGQQRPLMGPPETPSRVMQASPSMYPTLQFSPDLFSAQSLGPATAPIYPQQRLFWDQPGLQPDGHHMEQFQNPYPEAFDASFHSSSTVVPNYSPVAPQEPAFDLPRHPLPPGPFLDTTAFPMPFQTSPRPAPPAVENPTQFLSSPARRFGGTETSTASSFSRPNREVPAYHHQIEESRRERELERKRSKNSAKRADADLIMSSVKRALSPTKGVRPGLKRSQTHSGVPVGQQPRRTSRAYFNDSASASSAASVESGRNGRSSPLKSIRQRSSSAMQQSKLQRARTAMSLAIDENGVAKTVLQQLPESDDDMDMDDESQSVISSADEGDFTMIRSQNASFAFDDDDVDPRFTQPSMSRHFEGARSATGSSSAGRHTRRGTMQSDSSSLAPAGKGDAQKALRAIIEDRTRSASTQGGYSSSRRSDSSVQFHSSPPIQSNQFGDFNPSPTTITDPELATPSTDQETYGSLGSTRCICNSLSLDGSAMIQWSVLTLMKPYRILTNIISDSCSKWLHASCVGVDKRRFSDVYICFFCEQTPVRHPSNRGSIRSSMRGGGNSASPLAHKSVRPDRRR